MKVPFDNNAMLIPSYDDSSMTYKYSSSTECACVLGCVGERGRKALSALICRTQNIALGIHIVCLTKVKENNSSKEFTHSFDKWAATERDKYTCVYLL